MGNNFKILVGICGILASAFLSFGASAQSAYCAQSAAYFDASNASCKLVAQQLYAGDTHDCAYYAFGGGAVGAGGLGSSAILLAGSNPWGLAALGVGAIGTGLGIWGSSSCYSDAGVMRDLNLAHCDYHTANLKAACESQHSGEGNNSGSSSGDSAKSGAGTGSGAGNNGGNTSHGGEIGGGCGTKCRKGTVEIH